MKPDRPENHGLFDRMRDWRLPVRYRVPPRNDLIAFALMALAFGLMVGLAIAPGWGNAGSKGPVIALPAGEPPAASDGGEDESTASVSLQPPAGGEGSSSDLTGEPQPAAQDSAPTTSLTTDVGPDTEAPDETPTPESPSKDYADPPPKEDPGEEVEPGPSMTATVVAADEAGYAVADKAGNLLYVHFSAANAKAPKVGRRIGTDIDPVDNGTFVQSGPLEDKGKASSLKLSGFVSFVDPASGVITVSSRGVSIAVNAASAIAKSDIPPVQGAWVTGTVSFGKATKESGQTDEGEDETEEVTEEEPIKLPALTAKSIEGGEQPSSEIDLSGPVKWDKVTRDLTIGADGFGVLNRELTIKVPKSLTLKGIKVGLAYAASVKIAKNGGLSLIGLSANYSLEAAKDPAQAFGTHAR